MSLPSDPAARKAIKKCMDELSASMSRIDGERDFIKEAIANICEEYEMSKKTFRKLAKVYHKQNFSKEVADTIQITSVDSIPYVLKDSIMWERVLVQKDTIVRYKRSFVPQTRFEKRIEYILGRQFAYTITIR